MQAINPISKNQKDLADDVKVMQNYLREVRVFGDKPAVSVDGVRLTEASSIRWGIPVMSRLREMAIRMVLETDAAGSEPQSASSSIGRLPYEDGGE